MSNSLTLSELAPYIEGKQFTGTVKKQARVTKANLELFLTKLEEDDIAKDTFNVVEIANEFYEIMTDFKYFIPKEQRIDAFYAAKLGGTYYNEVPSFCVYMIKKCYAETKNLPNLIFKYMPQKCIKEFFSEGYLSNGVTMHDVICNICNDKYVPVSAFNPKCKYDEFTEIYIASEDMVAAVPNAIADLLTDVSCKDIVYTSSGLAIGGNLLRTMSDYVGAINSIYDLRGLL